MLSFKDYITEGKEGKNVHLTHIEDRLLNNGVDGVREAIYFIGSLRNMFSQGSKGVKLTTKWDGAPAVICGINPENGRFFVGTKSVFNKTPKLNYTNADIDANHSGEGLNKKLKVALKYLSELGIKDVVQGDIMFTEGDLQSEVIDGEKCVVFQPNTIMYAVPEDSKLAQQIKRAKIGVVFHTSYQGKSLEDMKASFHINIGKFNHTKNVWFRDAELIDATGAATFDENETARINSLMSDMGKVFRKLSPGVLNKIALNNSIRIQMEAWNNKSIREGQPIRDPRAHVLGLIAHVRDSYNEKILSAKSPRIDPHSIKNPFKKKGNIKSIQSKEKEKTDFVNFFTQSAPQLVLLYTLYNLIIEAKSMIVSKLNKIKSIGTFLKTADGYKVTAPEGFVAINEKGNAVKLVDRLTFSHANFTVEKNWSR